MFNIDSLLSMYDVPGDLWNILNFGPNRVFIYDNDATFCISALLVDNVQIGGSAEWGNAGGIENNLFDLMNKGFTAARNFGNLFAKRAQTVQQFRSPYQTVVDWKSTGEFTLDLKMLFASLTPKEDIRQPVHHLNRCVYPIISPRGMQIIPPLGYAPTPLDISNSMGGRTGCVGVEIGTWFAAPPVFVVSNVSFDMSKEQTPAGLPLYAMGSVRLKCAHQVGIDNLEQWFNISMEAYIE